MLALFKSVKTTSHLQAIKLPKQTVKSECSEPLFDSGSLKNESHQVPAFVLADWTSRFLPTLYHVMFCAEKPFHDFCKGSRLVDTIQQVLDVVHPNHGYVVTTESKLYQNVATFSPLSFTSPTDHMSL
jgi:hypothetical protein